MANRRMFSLDVVDTDNFLDMSATAQLLYFHLGMRADDDGFIASPKQIMRMTTCTNSDMVMLIEKGYVIPFESGVIVVRHWNENNYIRSDRRHPTKYVKEYKQLTLNNDIYDKKDTCLPNDGQVVDKRYTEDRLGKDRLNINTNSNELVSEVAPVQRINYQQIADLYNNICKSFPRLTKLSDSRKKAIKARLNIYTIEDFQRLFEMAEASSFLKGQNNRNWSANFDWLIKDANMAKVLDGNYQDKGSSCTGATLEPEWEEPDYLKNHPAPAELPDDVKAFWRME